MVKIKAPNGKVYMGSNLSSDKKTLKIRWISKEVLSSAIGNLKIDGRKETYSKKISGWKSNKYQSIQTIKAPKGKSIKAKGSLIRSLLIGFSGGKKLIKDFEYHLK